MHCFCENLAFCILRHFYNMPILGLLLTHMALVYTHLVLTYSRQFLLFPYFYNLLFVSSNDSSLCNFY